MAKATVLIVEDSPDISDSLADAFRFAEFNPLQAPDAIHALQLASEYHPDLILMDIQLPDLDGLSVTETLKSDPATASIPVVAMTAYEIVGEQARKLSRHCVGYAQKPVRPRDLINLVTAVLKVKSERKPSPPKDRILRAFRK
jgi:two-component system, cell cycle response regulator DivK